MLRHNFGAEIKNPSSVGPMADIVETLLLAETKKETFDWHCEAPTYNDSNSRGNHPERTGTQAC